MEVIKGFLYKISKKAIYIWLVLIAGIILTFLATFYTKKNIERQANREYASLCNEIKIKIVSRLNAQASLLNSGAALFSASDTVSRNDWNQFYEKMQVEKNLYGVQGIGYAMIVPKNEVQQHIQKVRNEGFPDYTIKPESDRNLYSTVIYIEPFAGRNLRAFGYDMLSEPIRCKMLETARDSDIAVLSGKITLMQETNKDVQPGTIMCVPVYKNNLPATTIDQRRKAIIGWVYSPYRMNDLMHGIIDSSYFLNRVSLKLQIYDDSVASKSLLYDSQKDSPIFQENISFNAIKIPVIFNGRKWILHFTQSKLPNSLFNSRVLIVFFGGIILSALLFLLFLSLFNTQNTALKIAEQLTLDLKERENSLQESYRKLQASEKELSNTRILLQAAFDQSPIPMVVVAAPDFTFKIINKATEDFLLVNAENYLNKRPIDIERQWLEYTMDGKPVVSLADLPLPLAMQGITTKNKEMIIERHDGSRVVELASASPIFSENGELIAGILIMVDLTVQKTIEEKLRENERSLQLKNNEYEALNEELRQTNEELYIAKEKAEESKVLIQQQYQDLQATEEEIRANNEQLSATSDELKQSNDELQIAKEQAQENEIRFKSLFQNMNNSASHYEVIFDKQGIPCDYRFLDINQFYEKSFGIKASDLIGKTLLEVFPATEPLWLDSIKEVVLTSKPKIIESYSAAVNMYFELIVYVPQKGKMAMMGSNITERKLMEQKLIRNEKELIRAQKLAHIGSWYLDFETNKVSWSEELYKMYGFDPTLPPPILTDSQKLFTPESWELLSTSIAKTGETGIPYEIELITLKEDNSTGWMWARGEAIWDKNNKITGLYGVAQDITEQKKIEQQLKNSKEKAEESDQLKTAFLENISHEVRTPMNAILGFSQLLLKPNLNDAKRKQFTDVLQKATHQLLTVVDHTITLAHIETNQLQINRMEFSPAVLLANIFEEASKKKQLIGKEHIMLVISEDKFTGLTINNDYTRINEIFTILLDNALKFTEKGTVEFGYTLSDTDQARHIQFYVKDTGIGIPLDKQQIIFKSFVQADKNIRLMFGGLGVGLTIAQGLVNLLKGEILINSEVNSGTEVIFRVPLLE